MHVNRSKLFAVGAPRRFVIWAPLEKTEHFVFFFFVFFFFLSSFFSDKFCPIVVCFCSPSPVALCARDEKERAFDQAHQAWRELLARDGGGRRVKKKTSNRRMEYHRRL